MPITAGVASAAASWQRWINPFVDASREMNVPARVAAGERLYRDVVYHYGPVGPWLEGAAIELFGRRFVVLEAAALSAAILLFVSLWKLASRAGSLLAACLSATWAAALCFGAPNGGSFLFPYSFDALFALAGAFLCLALAAEPPARPRGVLSAAGLALALSSKPEIGVAAALVLLVGGLRAEDRRRERRRALRVAGAGGGVAILLWALAIRGAARADLYPEGPLAIFAPPAEWRAVYGVISGLARPAEALASVSTALFLGVLILAGALTVSKATAGTPRAGESLWIGVVGAAVLFFLTSGAGIEDRLPALLAPMPAVAGAAALWQLRRPLDSAGRARWLLFAFAAACASRVILGLTYGAVTTPYSILAVPGLSACAAVIVLDLLPRRLAGPGTFRRLIAVVLLALAVVAIARWRRLLPPSQGVLLHTPSGSLRLPAERALATAQVLAFLSTAGTEATLGGFPEAGFFNFVTGIRNPLRQEQVFPGHLDRAAEDRLAERLERSGPRYLLLINQTAPAFGSVAFGRDYAKEVGKVLARRYHLAASFGDAPPDAPVGWPRFFIRVYERNGPAETIQAP
jgi:hypothetical protein